VGFEVPLFLFQDESDVVTLTASRWVLGEDHPDTLGLDEQPRRRALEVESCSHSLTFVSPRAGGKLALPR
jgi:hypothetical protein